MQNDICLLNFIIISFSPKAHGSLLKANVVAPNCRLEDTTETV